MKMPRLPKEVEKQAELAEQAFNRAYGTPQQPPEAPKPADATPAPATGNDQTATAPTAPTEEPGKPDADKPQDTVEDGDLNHWKQRAKVAEGRLSKEMPRMAQTIRELKDQLTAAEQKLRDAQSAQAVSLESVVKPEEVEQYGKDFIDMVGRVARSATPGVDQSLKQQVEESSEQTRKLTRQRFFEELGRDAPQWEKLNTNEDFLAHLSGLDPYTGRTRQELFDDAYQKLDAWRIANFFNSFSESRRSSPEPQTPSLADQVTPSASRAQTAPPAKKIWNAKEVARFYDDVRRGSYTAAEAAGIEKDIFAAQSEGRFR
jgi:hypothetical protein